MLLEKDMFVSDLGKELWERYFGFLDKKPAPKQEVDDVEDPYERLFPDPKKKEKRTEQQQPKEAAKGKEDEESSKPSLLEEIGSQFRKEQTEQTIHRPREQKTIDIKVDEKEERLTTHSMNLHNVVKYFKNKGVVGEEGLAVAITLALINKASFGVEGYSGSGKTFITDKLIELVEDKVYTIGLSSKLAIFSDLMRMNTKQIIYIPELQKAMQDRNSAIIEVIKNLTEGKDATRLVTNKNGRGATEFKIKKGFCIVYTLALENYYKKDEESSRRFIRFRTDSSQEHLAEIHESKARGRHSLEESEKNKMSLELRLKNTIYECMQLDDIKILDPFADYLSSLIPRTQKSIGYVDHYYSLLDACAKFHSNERTQLTVDGQRYLLINLEDHFTVFQAYFGEFIKTLKDFSKRKDESEKDEDSSELDYFKDLKQPDWTECFRSGLEVISTDESLRFIAEKYNDKIEQWVKRQLIEDRLYALDYITGKRIVIGEMPGTNLSIISCETKNEKV